MRAAAYRYIEASLPPLPVFVLFTCRKTSPSRAEKKSSLAPLGSYGAWMVGRRGTVWGPGQSFAFPCSELAWGPRYLHKTSQREPKKASDSQRAVYQFGETVQRFQQIHVLPDVSGLNKPPPAGSGQ